MATNEAKAQMSHLGADQDLHHSLQSPQHRSWGWVSIAIWSALLIHIPSLTPLGFWIFDPFPDLKSFNLPEFILSYV